MPVDTERAESAEAPATQSPVYVGVAPTVVWAHDHFRPERIHAHETCDGLPRRIRTDYGTFGVGMCGDWLDQAAGGDPDSLGLERCARCVGLVSRLGGIV